MTEITSKIEDLRTRRPPPARPPPPMLDLTPQSDYATPPPRDPGLTTAGPQHSVGREACHLTPDNRFRHLLGEPDWHRLPAAVRHRFTRPLAAGGSRLFRGRVVATRLSLAGSLLAHLARLAGSPLPDQDGATGPASVLVTESPELGGQVWTRTYPRPGRFPQTINSVKRFMGPTGLEEYLGYGLVMRLVLAVEDQALVFRSAGYDLMLGSIRLPLPRWLTPGTCTIAHRDLGYGRFAFTLALHHPRLGCLASQEAIFEEVL